MLYKVSVTGGTIDSWTATNNSAPGMDYMTQNAMSQGKALAPQLPHIGQQFQKATIQQMTSEASMDYSLIRQNAFIDELEKLADQRQWLMDKARTAFAAKGQNMSNKQLNSWLDTKLSDPNQVMKFTQKANSMIKNNNPHSDVIKNITNYTQGQLAGRSHKQIGPKGSDFASFNPMQPIADRISSIHQNKNDNVMYHQKDNLNPISVSPKQNRDGTVTKIDNLDSIGNLNKTLTTNPIFKNDSLEAKGYLASKRIGAPNLKFDNDIMKSSDYDSGPAPKPIAQPSMWGKIKNFFGATKPEPQSAFSGVQ